MRALAAIPVLACSLSAQAPAPTVAWRPWSPAGFAEAKAAKKLVLVDAAAAWCHWCHVMDEKSYADPAIARLLNARFVPIRADIDEHPDAQEQYSDIGWPGTAIYAPDGTPLLRRRGFIPPEEFKAILQGLVKDLDAGTLKPWKEEGSYISEAPQGGPEALRSWAEKELDARFDSDFGGWGEQKYPISMNLEEALARPKDPAAKLRALYTLKQQRAITDPVWGGIFQYSVGPDWHQVHFEKLTTLQAGYLENLADAFRATGDADFLEDAKPVAAYLRGFMAHPEGGFSATMDADAPALDGHAFYALDDAGRRKAGLPRIETRRFAKEQGLVIAAFARLSDLDRDPGLLREARAALAYAESRLASPEGGYFHDAGQREALFLGDQVGMLHGLLALHEATGEAPLLARAEKLAAALDARLKDGTLYRSRTAPKEASGAFAEVRRPFDDNIALARCLLRLEAFTGEARYKAEAEGIVAALATPAALDDQGRWLGDFALAARELKSGLGHLAVVGPKADPRTRALFDAARRAWLPGAVLILHDPADGEPRNPDLGFPALKEPAAFLCGGGTCSRPFTDPETLAKDVRGR